MARHRELRLEFSVSARSARTAFAAALFVALPLELDSATVDLQMSVTLPTPTATYSRLITGGDSGDTVLNKNGGSTYLAPGPGGVGIGTMNMTDADGDGVHDYELEVQGGNLRSSGYAEFDGVKFGNFTAATDGGYWGDDPTNPNPNTNLVAKPNNGTPTNGKFYAQDDGGTAILKLGPAQGIDGNEGAAIDGSLEVGGALRACANMDYKSESPGKDSAGNHIKHETLCSGQGVGRWYVQYVANMYTNGSVPVTGNMFCCHITE